MRQRRRHESKGFYWACAAAAVVAYTVAAAMRTAAISEAAGMRKVNAASEHAANETLERKINARTDGVTDD